MKNLKEFRCDRHYCDFKAFIGLKHLTTIIIMEQWGIYDLRDFDVLKTLPNLVEL